jgi:hypothetical protein
VGVGGGQGGALQELRRLDLNGNFFGDVGVLCLASSLSFHARLRSLSVSHCHVTDLGREGGGGRGGGEGNLCRTQTLALMPP